MRATKSRLLGIALAAAAVALLALVGPAGGAPKQRERALVTLTLDTLPIANGFPLDVGIAKGFFQAQGLEIKKVVFQSGNDIVLAMANRNGDIGYIGWVPAMIARTQGIPVTTVSASDVEATSEADNWQNIMVKGSSSIRSPADLAGKTIAVNALKGVGEVMIKAALKKVGVDPGSIKLVAIPFPAMRTALANGQIDAMWAPEPFVTQALTLDGARVVMAPGPVLGKYFPIGTYVALHDWTTKNPGLATKFHDAMSQSLAYAQAHPDEVRALLPPAIRNIRLPVWSSLIDRRQLLQLANYAKEFGVISTLPNLTQLVPASIASGLTLQGTVSGKAISLKLDGKSFKTLREGSYTFVVGDRSATQNFHLQGPGVNRKSGTKQVGRLSFTVKLAKGTYTFSSDARPSLKGSFRVV
ncbi:MAG TPA: ABC transporter substrate-binding protein [Gaiellaceae bacterium]|nr:ABC transporter substrate-binding protein [Gaiellaceae bacterium]